MAEATFDGVNVGDEPIDYENKPITRRALALYAGASGDHNPIHIDIDFAKSAGLDDVIAHGMLVMAYLGRGVTQWVPQSQMRSFIARFTAITRVGDKIRVTGKVVEKMEEDGEKRVKLELTAQNQDGEVKAGADAVVALS